MDSPLPPTSETPKEAVPTTSVWSKIVQTVTSPSKVFNELARTEKALVRNWLLPTLLFAAVAVPYALLFFTNSEMLAQIRRQQVTHFNKQVTEGKMPQQAADQIIANIDRMAPYMYKGSAILGGTIGVGLVLLVLSSIVLALVTTLSTARISFPKAMEITAMSSVILILTIALSMGLGTVKSGLLASPRSLASIVFLMNIWYLCVLSVGVSIVGGIKWRKAAMPIFALYLVYLVILILKARAVSRISL